MNKRKLLVGLGVTGLAMATPVLAKDNSWMDEINRLHTDNGGHYTLYAKLVDSYETIFFYRNGKQLDSGEIVWNWKVVHWLNRDDGRSWYFDTFEEAAKFALNRKVEYYG